MSHIPFALEIQNVSKTYGTRKVVDDLSLSVPTGDVFGFLGPNGAGKSTTIRIILSLVKADSGDVKIFGKSISGIRQNTLSHIGAMIEKSDFYLNLTAEKNLKMLADMTGQPQSRVDEVLKIVRLDSRKKDKVKKFSQGMKQRLGIAQSLLNYPDLLVLDEPTNGLDPAGMKEIRDLILELASTGITIFISSHLLSEVEKICTSMVIIKEGVAVQYGKVKELLAGVTELKYTISTNTPERAESILSQLSHCRMVIRENDDIIIKCRKENIPEIISILINRQIQIFSVIPSTSLEDYFLELTEDENSRSIR